VPPPSLGDLLNIASVKYGAHIGTCMARARADALRRALGLGAGQVAAYLPERDDGFLRVSTLHLRGARRRRYDGTHATQAKQKHWACPRAESPHLPFL
jgi:hypothetical protein